MTVDRPLAARTTPWVLTAALVFHVEHVMAAENFTINPFSKQALSQMDWKNFPVDQLIKQFRKSSEKQDDNATWDSAYSREFASEFGITNEYILKKKLSGDKVFRLHVISIDIFYSNKCIAAQDKIRGAIGKEMVHVDKSHVKTLLISKESKETMPWHELERRMQWIVGDTSLILLCLGSGQDSLLAEKNSIVSFIIEDKETAVRPRPILWLACSVLSKDRLRDGRIEAADKATEMLFGVDFDLRIILREDYNIFAGNAVLTEDMFSFKTKNGESFKINRRTGSINGDEIRTKVGDVYVDVSMEGDCVEIDRTKKKF